MSRLHKRKQKKKKIILSFLLIVFILIAVPSSYIAWGYYNGLQKAQGLSELSQEEIAFKGDEEIEGKINVLLIGVDTRGEETSNSDSIMIAQYDTDAKRAKVASILRDIYADIPGEEIKRKINASYMIGGADLLRETIKEMFDIDIHYYAIVDFNGFVQAVDIAFPDGIEIDVKQEMSHGIYQTIYPGLQNLNGKQLLGYARFRHDSRNDFGRAERQQEVVQAVTEELMSVSGALKLPTLVGSVQPFIATNIDNKKLLSVMTAYLSSDQRSIDKLIIPAEGTYDNERVDVGGQEQEVLSIDVEENKRLIQEFLGKMPEAENLQTDNEAERSQDE